MKILLTGAFGFIGTHLRGALADHDVDLFRGDVTSSADWKLYRRDYDAAIHLAALISPAESMDRPEAYRRVNVAGTQRMLKALEGRVGRFLLASSCSVYGECPGLAEDAELAPRSVYGQTKVRQEELLARVPSVLLRLFSVYGPGQTNPVGGLVGMLARPMLQGRRATVFEDGKQQRDMVEVSDVCRAFRLALGWTPGTYNIGTGLGTPVVHLARELAYRLGAPEPLVTGKGRVGDIRTAIADARKARAAGWEPQVGLGEGLTRYVRSLRSAA